MQTEKKKQYRIVRTIRHGVGKKDKVFKQIRNNVRNGFKVFYHLGGLDSMEINNISNTSSINQILKRSICSIQNRRKVNIGTGQEQLEK